MKIYRIASDGETPLRYDPSINRHNGKKLIPGDLLKTDDGRVLSLERNSGFILETTVVDMDNGRLTNRSVNFSVDPTDKDVFLNVTYMGRNFYKEQVSGLNAPGELGSFRVERRQ